METATTQIAERYFNFADFENRDADVSLTEKRLIQLTALNAEASRKKALFPTRREELEAALMTNPLSIEKTFSRLGFLLGVFPPAAMFARVFIDTQTFNSDEYWILAVFVLVNAVSAAAGFYSGKYIGKIVADLERVSWTQMILTLPFIGIFWGILAGGAGGMVVLFFGALLGASLGAAVGSVALTFFTVFHRLLKRGDSIEGKHFLPLAFGTVFIISAFILGL